MSSCKDIYLILYTPTVSCYKLVLYHDNAMGGAKKVLTVVIGGAKKVSRSLRGGAKKVSATDFKKLPPSPLR